MEIVDIRSIKLYESFGFGSEKTKKLSEYLETIDFSDISKILNYDLDIENSTHLPIRQTFMYDIYWYIYSNDAKITLSKAEIYILEIIKYKLSEYHNIETIKKVVFSYY